MNKLIQFSQDMFFKNKKNYGWVALFIFLVLFISYWPVLHVDYLFHDDLYYFSGPHYLTWKMHHHCKDYGQMSGFRNEAVRPLGGYLRCFYGYFVGETADGKFIRLFNVLVLTGYCVLAFQWLRKCGATAGCSLLAVCLIGLLTPYQTPIAQITNAYHLYAGILAVIALMVSVKAVEQAGHPKKLLFIVFILMGMALLIYPPAAMLYWSYLSVYILFKNTVFTKDYFLNLIKVGLPAIAAMIIPKLWAMRHRTDARAHFTHDIVGKFHWLTHDILPLALSDWKIFPSMYLTFFSLLLIAIACVIKIYQLGTQNQLQLKHIFLKFFICIGLVILTFIPNLIISESATNHRILIAISTILVLYTLFSLQTILKIVFKKYSGIVFLFLSILLICWASFTTYYNVAYYYAYPLHKEYEYFRESVRAVTKKLEEGTKIYYRESYLQQAQIKLFYGQRS
ncbi:MAG: hypothetical protein K0R24_215 [Gammaproteobacteria bacterium]|nr:hypothetical protein [Gammaproteobacteria bacterium]